MAQITTLGIDLAKRVFALHGVDRHGQIALRRVIRRERLAATIASLPPCLIGIEACGGAHAWARQFKAMGHEVRLMAAKLVTPYRKNGKNDGNDAEAICEAVRRPNMRFVPVKSAEQQAVLALHRVRQGFIEERTAVINRIRGLLTEFGITLPNTPAHVRREAAAACEGLPHFAQLALADLREHLSGLDQRISRYDAELEALSRLSESAQRLMKIRGVGPLTAVAVVATVGVARDFSSGRQFAAWLGLVPRQHSSGGRSRLGQITHHGDAYLRTLFVQGARSVLQTAKRYNDRMSRWIMSLYARRGYHKTLVAIAAKNARIAWALLSKAQQFRTV